MNRSIAVAYGIAGISAAIAAIAVFGTVSGPWSAGAPELDGPAPSVVLSPSLSPALPPESIELPIDRRVAPDALAAAPDTVVQPDLPVDGGVVYVDETGRPVAPPSAQRRSRGEHEEGEEREDRGEREDDDDDDEHEGREHRRYRDDD